MSITAKTELIDPLWVDSKPVPDGFWQDSQNRIAYMAWLGKTLNYSKPEDWFQITKNAFYENRGTGFLACNYGDSPIRALREYNEKLTKHEWLFRSVPQGFWYNKENRQRYIKWLGKELNYKNQEDWYQITGNAIDNRYGGRLLQGFYNGSVILFLRDNLPEYTWIEWKLRSTPTNFWKDKANRLKYLEWLGEQLGFKCVTDYNRLQRRHLIDNHGAWLLTKYYRNSVKLAILEYKLAETADF
jgi:hypothetical protein